MEVFPNPPPILLMKKKNGIILRLDWLLVTTTPKRLYEIELIFKVTYFVPSQTNFTNINCLNSDIFLI